MNFVRDYFGAGCQVGDLELAAFSNYEPGLVKDWLRHWLNQSGVSETLFIGKPKDEHEFYSEATCRVSAYYMIVQGDIPVGFVGFFHFEDSSEFYMSLAIDEKKQGMGIGSIVLEFLTNALSQPVKDSNLYIKARVSTTNIASQKVSSMYLQRQNNTEFKEGNEYFVYSLNPDNSSDNPT